MKKILNVFLIDVGIISVDIKQSLGGVKELVFYDFWLN